MVDRVMALRMKPAGVVGELLHSFQFGGQIDKDLALIFTDIDPLQDVRNTIGGNGESMVSSRESINIVLSSLDGFAGELIGR